MAIAYTYRTVVPADDNLLRLRVDQPTKGLMIALDYTAATSIARVSVLDFIDHLAPATDRGPLPWASFLGRSSGHDAGARGCLWYIVCHL